MLKALARGLKALADKLDPKSIPCSKFDAPEEGTSKPKASKLGREDTDPEGYTYETRTVFTTRGGERKVTKDRGTVERRPLTDEEQQSLDEAFKSMDNMFGEMNNAFKHFKNIGD